MNDHANHEIKPYSFRNGRMKLEGQLRVTMAIGTLQKKEVCQVSTVLSPIEWSTFKF